MSFLPVPTLRSFAFWVGGTLLMLAGVVLGRQDVAPVAILLLVLPLVALLSAILQRPRFRVERTVAPDMVATDEVARVTLRATARRASRSGSAIAEDDPGRDLGLPHRALLEATEPGEVTETGYDVSARRRGRYTMNGLRLQMTDLFGFWLHNRRINHATTLAVTPVVVPLAPSGAHVYGATGETPIPQTALSGPDDVLVREYNPGDDVRRIHWPSTARSGSLMVRREEAAWDPTAWVLLDSRADVHPTGEGGVRPSFEWLVSAAASVGIRLLEDGFSVTLVDADGNRTVVAPSEHGASAAWLDPLVDVDVTEVDDLHEATTRLAQAGSENVVIALLGRLDPGTADLLVAATASRQEGIALVAAPDAAGRRDHDRAASALAERGWDVREMRPGGDFAGAWAARTEGVR